MHSRITKRSIPPGFTRRHTLRGHTNSINCVVWSPDGELLASASEDWTIRLWDIRTGRLIQDVDAHDDNVTSLAWSPNGSFLASGSADGGFRLWDVQSGYLKPARKLRLTGITSLAWSPDSQILAIASTDRVVRLWSTRKGKQLFALLGHDSVIHSLAWSPDGQTLASASADRTVRLWNAKSGTLSQVLYGHRGWVYSVAWTPDGRLLASGSDDCTIRLWDPNSGRQNLVLEGHTHAINGLSFSFDGQILASKSNYGVVRLWWCDTWEIICSLNDLSYGPLYLPALSFHPYKKTLATLGPDISTISVWDLDIDVFLSVKPITASVHYANAKVVLVGDSGVGKSGLGLVLIGQAFTPTDSTHGRHVWTFESYEIEIDNRRKETREVLLWDLAGQPGYRLIHQLHLNEVTVALVLFDARDEVDPFSGIRHWDRALRQAQRLQGNSASPIKKFLVSARIDRGGVAASHERIEVLLNNLNYDGYFETSAKEGWGIVELREAILKNIEWLNLPKISSTDLLQSIRQFLLDEKEKGRLLSNAGDLYRTFLISAKELNNTEELQAQFEACIGRVESRGLIRRLSFGNLVLLQPELLDSYASALIDAARNEPDGLGSIAEQDARNGNFRIPKHERVKDQSQEILLLIATIEDLLRHEVALRETTDDGVYLVFPSQLTRERPDLPDPEGRTVVFMFDGAVLNIYSTLVVRLSHSGVFQKQDLWKNAATFSAQVGGICGMFLYEIEEGRGELTLFFDQNTSEETRYQFEQYVRVHLLRRALPETISRRRVFICNHCNESMIDRQVNRRKELGYTFMNCPICDNTISLLDGLDRLKTSSTSIISTIDQAADARRERDVALTIRQGEALTEDSPLYSQELLVIKRRRLSELERKRAFFGVSVPPEIVMEIEDINREIIHIEAKLKIEKS